MSSRLFHWTTTTIHTILMSWAQLKYFKWTCYVPRPSCFSLPLWICSVFCAASAQGLVALHRPDSEHTFLPFPEPQLAPAPPATTAWGLIGAGTCTPVNACVEISRRRLQKAKHQRLQELPCCCVWDPLVQRAPLSLCVCASGVLQWL